MQGILSKTLPIAAFIWMLILFVLILGADLKAPEALVGNDYHTAFYVAGWLAAHGQLGQLYPPLGATSFHGAPFDLTVHRMLPTVDSHVVGQFMYSPLVAFIFSPLSSLPPAIGQLIWQCINIAFLCIVSYFIADLCCIFRSSDNVAQTLSKRLRLAFNIFCFSFCYLPIFNTLWLGQMDIVFGLLPLSLGLWLVAKKQSFAAGLVLSLILLKPQFMPVVALLCFGLALRKEWRTTFGVLLGAVILTGLSYATAGATVLHNWIASLKISEAMFIGDYRNPDYLAGSLPLAIIVSGALADRLKLREIAYGITAIALLQNLRYIFMHIRRVTESERFLPLLVLAAILPIFIYSPRLLTYDWSLLLIPINIGLIQYRKSKMIYVGCLALVLAINLEIILQFTEIRFVCPIALTVFGAVIVCLILKQATLACGLSANRLGGLK